MTTSPTTKNSARLPLAALAIGAFGIGTTEFAPMGMLPNIADGVDVAIPTAGLLVSAYAAGVTIGAPVTTLLLTKWPRRKALLFLMVLFVIGNLASALAPTYGFLMLARIVSSFSHGAFFGLGSLVAASLVPKEKQASAIAMMFLGLTLANIGGVPVATWLSQNIGWRESFAAIALLGLVAMFALRVALPVGERGKAPDVKSELRELIRPKVLIGILTTIMGAGSMFTMYTYINPILKSITNGTPNFITAMLLLVGIGFTIGNTLGGKFADRSLVGTLTTVMLILIGSMVLFPWIAVTKLGAAIILMIWGAAAFALVPPLQMWVMRSATGAPGLASSVNVGAFNLGNALGAAFGSLVINSGFGYHAIPAAGALLAGLALVLVILSAVKMGQSSEAKMQDDLPY